MRCRAPTRRRCCAETDFRGGGFSLQNIRKLYRGAFRVVQHLGTSNCCAAAAAVLREDHTRRVARRVASTYPSPLLGWLLESDLSVCPTSARGGAADWTPHPHPSVSCLVAWTPRLRLVRAGGRAGRACRAAAVAFGVTQEEETGDEPRCQNDDDDDDPRRPRRPRGRPRDNSNNRRCEGCDPKCVRPTRLCQREGCAAAPSSPVGSSTYRPPRHRRHALRTPVP